MRYSARMSGHCGAWGVGGCAMTRKLPGCWTMLTCLLSPGVISQRRPRKLISPAFCTTLVWWVARCRSRSSGGGDGRQQALPSSMLFSTACRGDSPVVREMWLAWCQSIWAASNSLACSLQLTASIANSAGRRFCQKPNWRSILPLDWGSLATRWLTPRQPSARWNWERVCRYRQPCAIRGRRGSGRRCRTRWEDRG